MQIPAYEVGILDSISRRASEEIKDEEDRKLFAKLDVWHEERRRRKAMYEMIAKPLDALKKLTKKALLGYIQQLHKRVKALVDQVNHYEDMVIPDANTIEELTFEYLCDPGNRSVIYKMALKLFPKEPSSLGHLRQELLAALLLARVGDSAEIRKIVEILESSLVNVRREKAKLGEDLKQQREDYAEMKKLADSNADRAAAYQRVVHVELNRVLEEETHD